MKKYRIKIEYQTGNSFGSYTETSYLDISWDDLEVAKENLQAIRQHWDYYSDLDSYNPKKSRQQWEKDLKNYRWWFVGPEDYKDDFCRRNLMKLKGDNGETMQQWNFWCGYFEELIGASIEECQGEMSFKI